MYDTCSPSTPPLDDDDERNTLSSGGAMSPAPKFLGHAICHLDTASLPINSGPAEPKINGCCEMKEGEICVSCKMVKKQSAKLCMVKKQSAKSFMVLEMKDQVSKAEDFPLADSKPLVQSKCSLQSMPQSPQEHDKTSEGCLVSSPTETSSIANSVAGDSASSMLSVPTSTSKLIESMSNKGGPTIAPPIPL
eukprot:CAMPEP_0206400962 /NCGR_PEP_ID=MMETSP0294-20121207/25917_1 /ASSEMBLY_ACC=CAM_ASM_000327 /TAXON_ID=39354 /ORGANISM="Heterosigma akashiwo, Strain CCMP2393" /LENGTH=191 /DNA_ID=CAMNT_0053857433 /DNA_START=81 /DNA_END=652 /DNA_ORIENTATION=+